MNEKDKIYHKIKHLSVLENFFKNISILKILFVFPSEVQDAGFILIVIMNILIFAGYSAEKDDDGENVVFHVEFPGINKEYSKYILLVLGCIISIYI
jgi:hypothetical protein